MRWSPSLSETAETSITVESREAERLLKQLEERTGKEASQIILNLLRAETGHQRRLADVEGRRAVIEAAIPRYAARLPAHPETPEAAVGYDEDGLPKHSTAPTSLQLCHRARSGQDGFHPKKQ